MGLLIKQDYEKKSVYERDEINNEKFVLLTLKLIRMKVLIFCFLTLMVFGCTKYEGQGGNSSIHGVVIEQRYNALGDIIATYPAPDQDVYIIYGDEDNYFDDDIKTSFDGSFQFNYLRPGNYIVFVYEDCNTCPSGKKEVMSNITIEKRNQIIDLDTIYIKKY